MTLTPQPGPGIRLAELVAALSLATDSARGRPLEQGLGVCLLAVGLGEDAGLGEDQLVRVWYGSLLRHIGCTADNHLLAEAVGDEIAFAAGLAGIDTTSPEAFGAHLAGHLRRMAGPTAAASLARLPALTSRMREATAAVCEVAELLADRLGLGLEVRRDLALGPSAGTAQGSWVRLPASRCPCPSGSSRWLRRPAWPPRTTGQGNPRRRPWPSCASAPAGPSTRGWSSASTPAASGCSLAWRPGRSGTRCWPASRAPGRSCPARGCGPGCSGAGCRARGHDLRNDGPVRVRLGRSRPRHARDVKQGGVIAEPGGETSGFLRQAVPRPGPRLVLLATTGHTY